MKWISKGLTISESSCHKNMFIIDDTDGKFWNINSHLDQMLSTHLPDRVLDTRKPERPIMLSAKDVEIYGTTL